MRLLHRVRDEALAVDEPWFEASCLDHGLVGPLLAAFPEATVVQVVRHPVGYVRSAQDWGAYRFGGRPAEPPALPPPGPAAVRPLERRPSGCAGSARTSSSAWPGPGRP